jgi:hypothetical protein
LLDLSSGVSQRASLGIRQIPNVRDSLLAQLHSSLATVIGFGVHDYIGIDAADGGSGP